MDASSVKKAVFAESCTPPLQSGEYIMKAVSRSKTLGDSVTARQELWVEGPRFAIAEEDICCVYPPKGGRGSFGNSLPHIVFNRKTLPWERSTDTQTNETVGSPSFHTPWLALLQLREGEGGIVSTDTVQNAVNPNSSDIYVPRLHLRKGEETEMCSYMDIETSLFRKVFPAYEDLVYLCHARKTEPYTKSDDTGGPGDEWRSVVMGARMSEISDEGKKNRVYLISLEGYGDYSHQTQIDRFSHVRLIVLYSWTYEAVSFPWHFKEICSSLKIDSLGLSTEGQKEEVLPFLGNGYIPMRHQIRNGDQTVSFYRGPLAPAPIEHQGIPSVSSADSLYIYDPDIGMFDVSYACAWQLGRLIALNQKSIAMKLLQARNTNRKQMHAASLQVEMNMQCSLKREEGQKTGLADSVLLLLDRHLRRKA